jgi:hypothetical protein
MSKKFAEGLDLITNAPESSRSLPVLREREYYALSAPPPPSWWRVRTPLDSARWCWTWADAMLRTRDEPTQPTSAESERRPA